MPKDRFSRDYTKLSSTNNTDTSFSTPASTTTKPTSDVFDAVKSDRRGFPYIPNFYKFIFFGVGSDNQTFSARIVCWERVGDLWIPTPLVEVALVLSTSVGVAGESVVATERFCDAITTVTTGGDGDTNVDILSYTDNRIGHLIIDVREAELVQVQYDMTGATSGNCLYKPISQ